MKHFLSTSTSVLVQTLTFNSTKFERIKYSNLDTTTGAVDRMISNLDETYEKLTIISTKLPEFRGTADEDPLKWIKEVERKTRTWSESIRMDRIRACMENAAHYWIERELSKCKDSNVSFTFDIFKTKFLARFLDEDQREFALNKIRRMKFSPSEHKVSSFIITFQHWYEQCYPKTNEKDMMEDLLSRFPADFRSRFMMTASLADVRDIDQFCAIAQRIEKGLRIERDEVRETSRLMSARNDETLLQLLQEMKEMKQKLSKLEHARERNPRQCYQCKKDWPGCGCTKKCRFCPGQYPKCNCKGKKDTPITKQSSGNENGSL